MASTAATIAKAKGNQAFKSGLYADAVGHYSAALLADPNEPTYPLNRAAAYLKLGKHRDAERDCATVLNLDGNNVKALFRRAQARLALDSLAEAEQDLNSAFRLDPANDSVKQTLAEVKKRRLETVKKQVSGKREPITVPPLSPSQTNIKKDPVLGRSITRNVPIEIVEPNAAAPDPGPSTSFLRPIQTRVLSPSLKPEAGSAVPKAQPRVGAAIFRAGGGHTVLRAADAAPPLSSAQSAASPSPSVSAPTTSLPTSRPDSREPVESPPLTYFAFSRAWHALPTTQERFKLLCRIPPASLSALFQTSLEPGLLVSILQAFSDVVSSATAAEIAAYMTTLPGVPRFGTVVLFLSNKEKELAWNVWDKLPQDNVSRRLWGL